VIVNVNTGLFGNSIPAAKVNHRYVDP
jgi:hypothetical protein